MHNAICQTVLKMEKDFKIGIALGVVFVVVIVIGLSTRPSLSIKARVLGPDSAKLYKTDIPLSQSNNTGTHKETSFDGNQTTQVESSTVEKLKLSEYSISRYPEEIRTEKFHIVRRGETLSGISYEYYGSANKWQKILDANREKISNPKKLRPGTKLIIPE